MGPRTAPAMRAPALAVAGLTSRLDCVAIAALGVVAIFSVLGCHDLDEIVLPNAGCSARQINVGGTCVAAPESCIDAPPTCGPAGRDNCCAYDLIDTVKDADPRLIHRSWDRTNVGTQLEQPIMGWQAQGQAKAYVSPFYLDRYEVTVGRFRRLYVQWETWLKSFPKDEQGRHYAVRPWDDTWKNPELIAMSNLDFRNALLACPAGAGQKVVAALEDQSGRSDNLPMTCLNWYEAYLFCMSDNARLPTESEWNYAAAGGSEQRPFPWSRDRETIGAEYANVGPVNEVRLFEVGSFPRGVGRYGQYDLAGNAIEFVIDRCDATGSVCAKYHTDGDLDPIERNAVEAPVARGGSFRFGWASARTAFRQFVGNDLSTGRHADTGMRCARNGR